MGSILETGSQGEGHETSVLKGRLTGKESASTSGAAVGAGRPSQRGLQPPKRQKPEGCPGTLATEGSAQALASPEETHLASPWVRFPNLFPPLKPETVARRTVEAVQLNQALLLLPWTMHALIILKRYG